MGNVPPPPGSSWPAAPDGVEGSTDGRYPQDQDWADPPGGRLTPPGGHPQVDADSGVWAWPPPRPVRTSAFAPAEAPSGESYHTLARTTRSRWWMTPLTLLVFVVLLSVLWMGVVLAMTIVSVIGGSGLAPDSMSMGAIATLAFGLASTALLMPIVFFLVRVVQWRRLGSLMSVEGALRWSWLGRCLVLATGPVALCLLLSWALSDTLVAGTAPEAVSSVAVSGTGAFLGALLVIFLVVPFQAAAEEMTLRGMVMQLVGSLVPRESSSAAARVLRSPWPAILAAGTLFACLYAAGHPGNVWTTSALAVLGVTMAWLTWRTGGIEAAVGLHSVNSLVQYTLVVYDGRIDEIGTGAVVGAGLPPGAGTPFGLVFTVVQAGLFALLVVVSARRRGVRRVSP